MPPIMNDFENENQKRPPLSWYKERLEACIEREGLNHSYKRVLLLEALYEKARPVSVEELYFKMGTAGHNSISINTVYRIIKLLLSFKIAVRIEIHGTPKYILGDAQEWKADFVCDGEAERFRIDLPQSWRFTLEAMLAELDLTVEGELEIKGKCRKKGNS